MIGHRKCQDFFYCGIREYPLPVGGFLYIFWISAYFSQQGVGKFSNCLRGDLVSPWALDPWGDGKFLEFSWG